MKRISSLSLAILITLCLIVGSERRAWGYVDPGAGFIALQTFASIVAAYAYLVRRRIRAFFTRKQTKTVAIPIAPEATASRKVA